MCVHVRACVQCVLVCVYMCVHVCVCACVCICACVCACVCVNACVVNSSNPYSMLTKMFNLSVFFMCNTEIGNQLCLVCVKRFWIGVSIPIL